MRGRLKFFAMSVLAGGLAIVPAMGTQGAGALGGRHINADSHLVSTGAASSLLDADRLVEQRVLRLTVR